MQDNATPFRGFTFDTSSALFEDPNKKQIINLVTRGLTDFNLTEKYGIEDHCCLILTFSSDDYTHHYVPMEYREKVYNWMKTVMLWLNSAPGDVEFISTTHADPITLKVGDKPYYEVKVKDIQGVEIGDTENVLGCKTPTWYIKLRLNNVDNYLQYLDKESRDNAFLNLNLARDRQNCIYNGTRLYMPSFNCLG